MKQFPTLYTKRLILNEVLLDDSNAIFEMFSDPEVVEFYDFEVFKREQEAITLIENDSHKFEQSKMIRWAIREKSTGELIGGCGVNRFELHNHVAIISHEFKVTYMTFIMHHISPQDTFLLAFLASLFR